MSSPQGEADLLREMVSIPSPTGDTDAMGTFLVKAGEGLGFETSRDGVGNVTLRTGAGSPHILFLCHMDTVPGDLEVRVDDGLLHGRGSVDAKGCLAAAMEATIRHARTDRGSITIVAVPDEEGPSRGVREVVKGPPPDCVIVGEPSGWDGITIGYRGAHRYEYSGVSEMHHSGAAGPNSIEEAVAFWGELKRFCRDESEGLDAKGTFDALSASLTSMDTHNDGVALRTRMVIDLRIPWGYDISRIASFIEDTDGTSHVDMVGSEPPVLAPKDNELVRALSGAIRSEGGRPTFKRKTGTSDMNIAAQAWAHVPIVAYGPGDSRFDHRPDERLVIAEYARAVHVLEKVLDRLLE
jgi:LysW-gamma-L-lysine carboxypeptidase